MNAVSPLEFFLCRNKPRLVAKGVSQNYHILVKHQNTGRDEMIDVTAEQMSDFITALNDAPAARHPVHVADEDIVWDSARRDVVAVRHFMPYQDIQGGEANSRGMYHTIGLPMSAPRCA